MTDDLKNKAIIYQKLVRDRIPEIIRNQGKVPYIRKIEGPALCKAISEKVIEEAFELYTELRGENRDAVLKESADLLEIVLAALEVHGFTLDDLLAHAEIRRQERGGFAERIFLDQVGGGELCEIEFQKYPAFVFNPFAGGKLIHIIRTELAHSTSAWIASAFYSPGATNLLLAEMTKFLKAGGSLKLLLSTMGNITKPEYLEHLTAQVPEQCVKVFHPPDLAFDDIPPHFHVKTWLFEHTDGQGAMIIGSSNLTRGGLVNNIEWNYFSPREINIIYDRRESPFQSAVTEFDRIWENESTAVTDEFLAAYRRRRPVLSDWAVPDHETPELFNLQEEYGRAASFAAPNDAQKEALENLAEQRRQGAARAAVVAATGLGKTYLAAFDYQRSNCRSLLFIAHREDILRKARDTFRHVTGDPSFGAMLGRGNTETSGSEAVFAMIQTLSRSRHLDSFLARDFEYIVIDEFHHAEAASYQRILSHFQPKFLLGLTATPERMDGRSVLAYCDYNVAYEVRVLEAVNRGWLVPFQYFAIYDETDYEQIPWRGTFYDEAALDQALKNDTRTAIAAANLKKYLPSTGKIKALAFCSSVSHARYTAEKLTKDHQLPAVALWGETPDDHRHNAMDRLQDESDALNVICTVDLFNEGTDIPALSHVLFLRPTQSFTLFLQQLGRGLRKYPAKDFLVVLDFVGNFRKSHIAPLALCGFSSLDSFENLKPAVVREALEQRLPDGCYVSADIEVQRLWDAEVRQIMDKHLPLADRLKLVYQDIKQDLGRETPLELSDMLSNASGVDPYLYLKTFGSWLIAKKECENGRLSDEESQLLNTPGDYLLRHIETGLNPVKSYKMVVILALLKLEGTTWKAADIAREFLGHYLAHPDQIADFDALARSPEPEKFRIADVVAHLKRMPLDKMSNAETDCFILDSAANTFQLKPEYVPYWQDPFFRALVRDRTEFALARYFLRKRMQDTIYFSESIFSEGFPVSRRLVEACCEIPPSPGEMRPVTIRIDKRNFNADLVRDAVGNYKIAYTEDSPVAGFLRKTLSPAPEKDAKIFRLLAENDYFRLAVVQ